MSDDQHDHEHAPQRIRFTIWMDERGAFGAWAAPMVIEGIGSSVKDGELLIHLDNGLYSFNFAKVRYMRAETLEHSH